MPVLTSLMSEACKEAGIIQHSDEFMAENYILRSGVPICTVCNSKHDIVPRVSGINPACVCGANGPEEIQFLDGGIEQPLTMEALLDIAEVRQFSKNNRFFITRRENGS